MHVPFRVLEEVPSHEDSISPRALFVGVRDHALVQHGTCTAEKAEATIA